VIRALLKRKDLLINHRDTCGRTVLFNASNDCFDILIEDPCVDVNICDCYNKSALWYAIYNTSSIWGNDDDNKRIVNLISHGANVEETLNSIEHFSLEGIPFHKVSKTTKIREIWKTHLPSFKRFAVSNKYYPHEFKQWAFHFVLCCTREKTFCKDLIYLLLEHVAEAWKLIK
ncbi:hypothetical protein KAT92_06855, partial [Candidatus Babeliales bacterium]|nr:hypothetical protein [Candidatus Babeliales bacterium]